MFSVVLCFGGDFFHVSFWKEKSMHGWVIAGTHLIKRRQATFLFVIKLIFVFRAFQNLFSPSVSQLQFEKVLWLCANIERHCCCLAAIVTSFSTALSAASSITFISSWKYVWKRIQHKIAHMCFSRGIITFFDRILNPYFALSSIFQKLISTVLGSIITCWAWPEDLGAHQTFSYTLHI